MQRKFPHGATSEGLKEENKFMEEHGGWGTRLIFLMTMLPHTLCGVISNNLQKIRQIFRQI